jgi:hypothetical protein
MRVLEALPLAVLEVAEGTTGEIREIAAQTACRASKHEFGTRMSRMST